MNTLKIFLNLSFLIFSSFIGFSSSSLDSAKTFYNKKEYLKAQKIYETQLNKHPENFELNYNLGNCYYKIGNKGMAILYFEKAYQINPSDEDVAHNLNLLKSQLSDKFDQIPSVNLSVFFQKLNGIISVNFLGTTAIVLFVLSSILIFRSKKNRLQISFVTSWLPILIAISLILWAYVQKKHLNFGENAIILAYETKIMNEPNEKSSLIFKLHEGTKLKIIENKIDWLNIKAPDGTVGWIKSEDVGIY